MKKGYCLSIIYVLFSCTLLAQNYPFSVSVQKIEKDGFYAIQISEEVLKHCKSDFGDLRLIDEAQQIWPYLLRGDKKNGVQLVGQLFKNHQYTVIYGNPESFVPDYSAAFEKEIPQTLIKLWVGQPKAFKVKDETEEVNRFLDEHEIEIWIFLLVLAILFVFFTVKMIRDSKR